MRRLQHKNFNWKICTYSYDILRHTWYQVLVYRYEYIDIDIDIHTRFHRGEILRVQQYSEGRTHFGKRRPGQAPLLVRCSWTAHVHVSCTLQVLVPTYVRIGHLVPGTRYYCSYESIWTARLLRVRGVFPSIHSKDVCQAREDVRSQGCGAECSRLERITRRFKTR